MTKVNRVGEKRRATNGQWMEIIEWFNNKNITVRFEDKTIVKNKGYGDFKKGYIKNPNYITLKPTYNFINRIGEKRKANNGQWMEIIEYINSKNITVRFEDGSVVYNKSYECFKIGNIANPNYNQYSRVGEKRKAKNGQWMTIIEWFKYSNITIEFEDNTIVKNKTYNCFKKGDIKNPNYNPQILINRIGERNKANNGQWMEIIEYFNTKNITIRFEDGVIVTNKDYEAFKRGAISNPNYNPYNRVGEESISTNGQKMKITAYRGSLDLDVQFEDGTIVTNKTYYNFKKGYISNSNYNPYNRTGEKRKANNGQWMTITEYINSMNITIMFEDGSVVYNKIYDSFKTGNISNPNFNQYSKVGNIAIATNGQKMTIITYRSADDVDIQFEDGTIVYNKSYYAFKKGQILNPNYKIAIGISVNEFVIYYYLKKYGFIKAEKGSLKNLGFGQMELDCYHPVHKIAIEYDGNLHEFCKKRDKRKNKICKQNGITIIRIREPKCPVLNDNSIEYQINSERQFSDSFENVLKEIFKYINSITDLNIEENISFKRDKKIILKEFYETNINKDAKLRLGESVIANNGQKMKIIAYRGCNDIDIQFEDGTIVYNKRYIDFERGYIKNPNYRIGEKRKANNGQWMEIIEYFSYKNITVKFEDGTIIKNKYYKDFKIGKIANPNYNPYNRVGEEIVAKNGQIMKIIAYHNATNIDVQFEDGTIVYNRTYHWFKTGKIENPNYNPRIGETNIATNGQKMTIKDYINASNIVVEFEDGTIVKNKSYSNFKIGYISNPNFDKYSKIKNTAIATNGQKMKIIAYRGYNAIDVQFEDGTIVYNKTYANFIKGYIPNPNFKKAA